MSKLSEIIDAATGDTAPIPSLLRRLKALASELDSTPIVEWVDLELSGYLDPDVVPPPYRGPFKSEVIARWDGPGGSHATMPLPSTALPEAMRKAPYELVFRQSVSELQKLAQSDKLLMHAWPAVAVAEMNRLISRGEIQPEIPMGALTHAYRQFSPALIDGILDAIRNRVLDVALALERVVPRAGEPGAPAPDPGRVRSVVEDWAQEEGSASAWDIHIGLLSPQRWEELSDTDRAREYFGGHRDRPGITVEPIGWESLRMTPRWLGDDSSNAVAAIQPSNLFNRGAAEWDRFLAGARARQELALAISMIGGPEEPQIASPDGQMASVSIPVPAPAVAHVGGARIPLARAPSVVKDLGPADHDLALRLINGRDPKLPWWSLELTGAELFYGGGRSEMVEPTGTLSPLLISAAGEVVAAVWTSSDGAVRHYVIPWMPAWMPVLEWLGQRGIPELVLSTAGRIESGVGEEAKVAGAAHSEPPTIDPADPTAESTPTPIAQPTTSEAAGAVAGDATQDDRAIRRPPLSRLRKKVRTLPHDVWSASKQHAPAIIVTAIGGTVATVVGTVVAFHITSGNGSHGPDVPESSSPAPSTTSTVPASATASMTTTASTSTSPPPLSALPLAPPEEQVIRAGSSGEFLGREVIVGVGLAYPSWSALTITTAKLSCTTTNLDVGQAVSVAGKNADRDDYFRITLLQSERDVSSTVRVEELPLPSWPTGALCPQ